MASYLTYNNITIDISRTLRYVQQHLYSPDGSDRIGTRVTIEVEGIYSPFATSYGPDLLNSGSILDAPGFLPATTDATIREALATPRCQLLYVNYGIEVIRSPDLGFLVDVANGPSPKVWEVVRVTERTWHVRFRIETTIHECSGIPENPSYNGLLSNRWSQAHQIGEDRLTTIATEGVAVFRTDQLAKIGRNADAFRNQIIPPCPRGFQRKRLEVAVNPIGNVVQYRVIDQERFVNLGDNLYGVVDFAAVVSMNSVTLGSGLSSVASTVVEATFQGSAFGSKGPGYRSGNLLTWLVKLAIERLNLPVPGNQNDRNANYVIVGVNVQAAIDHPRVDLSLKVRIPPPSDAKALKALGPVPAMELLQDVRDSDLFDNVAGDNPQLLDNNTRGYYFGELFAQQLRVCLANCDPPVVPNVVVKAVSGYSGGTPSVPFEKDDEESQSPGFQSVAWSPETTDGGQITYYEVRTHYSTNTGIMVAPVCGDGTEPPVVIRGHNPITVRNVQFTGERIGAKPPVPHPVSQDTGEVLVGDPSVSWAPPVPAADGSSRVYRVAGEFTYVRMDSKSVIDPGDGLPMGAVPWATFAFEDLENRYTQSDQRAGITGPNT